MFTRHWAILGLCLLVPGCRQKEPPQQFPGDLGTADRPLLPTASTWNDPRLLQGQAEWHPFREPKAADEAVAEGRKAASGEGAAAAVGHEATADDVRKELEAYKEELASGTAEEISEFYADSQAATVVELIPVLEALAGKVAELGAALPDEKARLERLVGLLSPKALLALKPSKIEASSDSAAKVTLASLPELGFLPDVDTTAIPLEAHFKLGEDEYWYMESSVVPVLGGALPALQGAVAAMDGLIAEARAGTATAASVAEKAPAVAKMLEKLPTSEAAPEAEPAEAEEKPEDQG